MGHLKLLWMTNTGLGKLCSWYRSTVGDRSCGMGSTMAYIR